MDSNNNEVYLLDMINTVTRYKWLFFGFIAICLGVAGIFLFLQKPYYQSTCEIQYFRVDRLFPGYEEQSQNIVNKINESNKDKDYTLVFQTTPQGTISLVANGPTANGTYKFLLKSARQFIQEKNKVSNNLLQIYTDRLAKVEKELKQLDTQTKYRNTSKEITANLSDSLLRSSKLGYQQEAFNLKQNILMIRSFNARLLSEPNLGVVSGTHKPSIVVIAALLFGIIGGIVFVVIVDYVLEKVKGTKTQKA